MTKKEIKRNCVYGQWVGPGVERQRYGIRSASEVYELHTRVKIFLTYLLICFLYLIDSYVQYLYNVEENGHH